MFNKILLTLIVLISSFCLIHAAPGDLDSTFGDAGVVTYRFNESEDSFKAVGVQKDGKIVVAGKDGTNKLIALRYETNGALDTSFANNGIFTFTSGAFPSAIAIRDDDKIVIGGSKNIFASDYVYLLIQLNANGSVDSNFGTNGVVQSNLSPGRDSIFDIAIQGDGKIVATGSYECVSDGCGDVGIVRYNTDGSIDSSFSNNGIVIVDADISEIGYAIKIQNDGKIVVLSKSNNFDKFEFHLNLIRLMPDGSFDTGFGDNDGISKTNLNGEYFSFGDIAIQDDGKIVTLSSNGSNSTFEYAFTISRYWPDGVLDTGFGQNGKTIVVSGTTNSAQALAIQANGKILAVGHSIVGNNGLDIVVARVNPNGSFDSSFGVNGKVFTAVGKNSRSDYGFDAILQADGNLLVVGDKNMGTLFDYDAIILRYIGGEQANQSNAKFDFDGDNRTDVSIYRPSEGQWWFLRSSDFEGRAYGFGTPTDKPVPADFTGDGVTDIAFWRESSGEWFILRSEDFSFYSIPFGTAGDIPAPGDFDGDGKSDTAVYRPNDTNWYIENSSGGTTIQQFGIAEDKPVVADYDGDGNDDIAIYRPSVNQWWLNRSSDGVVVYAFGSNGDKTAQGDYTGDGKADVAFFRPEGGGWFVLRSEDQSFYSVPFGISTDIPTSGDYDGDGKTDTAVFRATENNWYIQGSTSGFSVIGFGASGDIPLPNVVNLP